MVKKIGEIYYCSKCGNVVDVTVAGGGELWCCGQAMALLKPQIDDIGQEKHVPVIKKQDHGYLVTIGTVLHPMVSNHYIMWVALHTTTGVYRQYLKSEDSPEFFFAIDDNIVKATCYCNLHGLWEKKFA